MYLDGLMIPLTSLSILSVLLFDETNLLTSPCDKPSWTPEFQPRRAVARNRKRGMNQLHIRDRERDDASPQARLYPHTGQDGERGQERGRAERNGAGAVTCWTNAGRVWKRGYRGQDRGGGETAASPWPPLRVVAARRWPVEDAIA